MEVAKLGQRQLFGMKKETLLKRVRQYFEQTQQAAEVVEYLVAILFRHSICVGDFSLQPLSALIRQIFMTETPNDTLRRHCVYFEDFFSSVEWQTVIQRLFSNKEDYQQLTKEAQLYNQLLEKKNLETAKKSDFQFDLVSIFKDANGKRHTWTLRDTKQVCSVEETAEVLGILTTLTIFQAAGVRRFAEYVKFKSKKGCIDAEHEAIHAELEAPAQNLTVEEKQPRKAKKPQELVPTASNPSKKKTTQKNQPTKSANCPRKRPLSYEEAAARADALYPLPGEEPVKSKAGKTPSKNSAATPDYSDTNFLLYGKTKEQIAQDRAEKSRQNRINKFLKGKKK
ncbi:hypothetical protein ACTXNW_19545 [Enterococcus malodoratus]|uniref:hypothetical protein n=1 Tax=Enterococcus malodoratus TaxID=71451 RepID=UPI003FD5C4C9